MICKGCAGYVHKCKKCVSHSDDLVQVAESMEELIEKFKKRKEDMEAKG